MELRLPEIIRETFQYVKKVGYMLLVRDVMKNGELFVKGKESNIVLKLVISKW